MPQVKRDFETLKYDTQSLLGRVGLSSEETDQLVGLCDVRAIKTHLLTLVDVPFTAAEAQRIHNLNEHERSSDSHAQAYDRALTAKTLIDTWDEFVSVAAQLSLGMRPEHYAGYVQQFVTITAYEPTSEVT